MEAIVGQCEDTRVQDLIQLWDYMQIRPNRLIVKEQADIKMILPQGFCILTPELQFERLTRELEVERQIVANQLERCRLGAESPGAARLRSPCLGELQMPPPRATHKSRLTDSSQSPSYRIRTESEQVSLYSPEQSSLHERSTGNSRSSTQMNSYSDSGYQEASSGYLHSQNMGKAELRVQHSFPGAGTLGRSSRAEGQASTQVLSTYNTLLLFCGSSSHISSAWAGDAEVCPPPAAPCAPQSAAARLRSPIVTEPKPLSSIFSTTLPSAQRSSNTGAGGNNSPYSTQKNSPAALRRVGSANSRSGSASRTTSPYQASAGSSSGRMGSPLTMVEGVNPPLTKQPTHSSSPSEHAPSTPPPFISPLPRMRSSYASQHSQLGQDLRPAMSPDRHIAPIYEDRTFQGPLYRSPSQTQPGTLYRSSSGVGSLQRTPSQRGTMIYQRNNYALNTAATYADPYRSAQYRPSDQNYTRQAVVMDDGATRSPSIDSIQKDPREFAWRDPELLEVIQMLQHHFPSVQANAAAYLQHLCFGDNRIKTEVCRLGGIKHLVDLLDHKVIDVQKNSCGAVRNLVYGKAMDENKVAVRNAGGVPALLRLLRKTVDAEVRELVTGVLWNLSSCDTVKMTIIRDALMTLTNTVIIPHSGWSSSTFDDDHKLKFHSSLVLRNTTGCLRNLAANNRAKPLSPSARHQIVENCICTLRNLSYRLELELPPSRIIEGQELDGLLGSETPSKEVDSSCWGRKKKKKKKKGSPEDTWDGVGPIPGFSKSPKGAEMLWHPAVVKPYLTLLAESSNPATLEGAAGSLQNLSAGNWKFAAYIRAAVRKEKGLPILVELLRMDNDRVVCSVATALRNMALDVRNKELIGKYAMRDLVNRLPGGNTTLLSDETVAAICCTLHEVTSKNMENAKALADTGGIEKLVWSTSPGQRRQVGYSSVFSMKVVKASAQVLNTLWLYRDLRTIYKKDGWNQNHFLTPVSTLERDRFKSQPTLPTSNIQMSPVNHHAASATSSPAMLGIKEHRDTIRDYQRSQSTMQFYNHQGDNSIHKKQYTGSGKPSPYYYPSPTREEPRRTQPVYYTEEPGRRNYDTYRMYMQHPQGFEDPYLEEVITYPPTADYSSQPHGLKSNTNYVDFYASTRRPSYRAEQYPGSPDSWV
ncbi:hypothetical protein F7725_001927 [Dissostichus mawsoni]|uniref:Plakophilin 4 n=1 Tax=Dissostichus mawsoni TaxID=36200 RepID=A0A7J5Y410_DISMA|nr:hypothetical protein F7725_001927 [Dissostichus mawsoni]